MRLLALSQNGRREVEPVSGTMQAEALELHGRTFQGLSATEAASRKARGQGNRSRNNVSRSYTRIFIDNAFPPVNVILFVISGVLVALGLAGDAVLTAGLVIGNVAVGVFQESRAKRQLDRIALLTRPRATVIRDGKELDIDPSDVVLGDTLVCRPGDQIEVDGSVLAAEDCSVDESLLSGESDVVPKHENDQVYSGTFCMGGSAVYEAEQVGATRSAQQITEKARQFRNVRTPLQREVGYVIWGVAAAVVLLGLEVAFSFQAIYGEIPVVESARAAAVIVALVPQGLWFMITVSYGIATVRIARTGALIQRMNAVESISHVDVLCFDKTGTLTTNVLELEEVYALVQDDLEVKQQLGVFAWSCSVSNRTNDAIRAAFSAQPVRPLEEVPFDSSRKWSALVLEEKEPFDPAQDRLNVYVLGAPEMLAPNLESPPDVDVNRWTDQGLRVLMFARGRGRGPFFAGPEPELPAGLQPLAYLVLKDQLRSDASRIIADFARAGIELKVISGDNASTVASLARQAGLAGDLRTYSGAQIADMEATSLEQAAMDGVIFGRVSPQDKERLVRALQRRGLYVAMTGDGVNDIPALKAAQVAVSMRAGSPVTQSVADIVLLDDSFVALPSTFLEGQRIRNGMQSVFRLFLVRTVSMIAIILAVAALADEFPVTPRHTSILAGLTVGIPALAFAAWAKPEQTSRYILGSVLPFVLPAALTVALLGTITYEVTLDRLGLEDARSALTTVATVAGIALIPFAADRPELWGTLKGLVNDKRYLWLVAAMAGALVAATVVPAFRDFFELTLLSVEEYALMAVGLAAWAVVLAVIWRLLAYESVLRERRSAAGGEKMKPA
jgi:cation-transporting ATPase E